MHASCGNRSRRYCVLLPTPTAMQPPVSCRKRHKARGPRALNAGNACLVCQKSRKITRRGWCWRSDSLASCSGPCRETATSAPSWTFACFMVCSNHRLLLMHILQHQQNILLFQSRLKAKPLGFTPCCVSVALNHVKTMGLAAFIACLESANNYSSSSTAQGLCPPHDN